MKDEGGIAAYNFFAAIPPSAFILHPFATPPSSFHNIYLSSIFICMPLTVFQEKRPKKILGIAAGKGGVGKSTVTVNLARAFKDMGLKVGILDADVYGPSIRKMLPETVLPVQKGERLFPGEAEGIKVISLAHFNKLNEALIVRAPIACKIVIEFLDLVDWGDLDYLLIDFPPGTGDIQLTLSQKAKISGVVMVTTPQEVAVMDVQKAIQMFDVVQVPILGVIENMSFIEVGKEKLFPFGKGGGAKLAKDNDLPLLGTVPIREAISLNSDKGIPLDTLEPFGSIADFIQLNY